MRCECAWRSAYRFAQLREFDRVVEVEAHAPHHAQDKNGAAPLSCWPRLPLHYLQFRDKLCSLGIAPGRPEDRHWRPETAGPTFTTRGFDAGTAAFAVAEIARGDQGDPERAQAHRLRARARRCPGIAASSTRSTPSRLDEPDEWEKIPVLDKDILRKLDHAEFMKQFCCVPHTEIAEFWRSGGSTGKPVFYPRTAEDITYGLLTWGRSFPCMGIGKGDLVPHVVSDRHSSGRPGLGAQRALVRCRHELGRRRQCLPLRRAARSGRCR